MKHSVFMAIVLINLLMIDTVNADTIITTTPVVSQTVTTVTTQTPQVVVVRREQPTQSVVVVQNTPEDDIYIRRPRSEPQYIDGNTMALVGTTAIAGGLIWGYHHNRHHHRPSYHRPSHHGGGHRYWR